MPNIQVRTYAADERREVEVLWDGEWRDSDLRQWGQREDPSWWANVRIYVGGSSVIETVAGELVRPVD